ncbi:hypothetical protein [Reichenbachiella versicolor]|uniref:hypothetical protein n=1 Tax=Reichenbachiella versicolor TaxID=1821036 RepID=UPI000D6EAB44|nr:hypothetical protein [Reichenbachiella versicolor]
MDDNIIYYIVLGVIYLISRLLKKKKPKEEPTSEPEIVQQEETYSPSKKKRSPVEDLLEQLSQEMGDKPVEKNIETAPAPFIAEPEPKVSERKISVTQKANKGAIASQFIERDRPVYEKNKYFVENEESNPTNDKIRELLADEEGIKSAIIVQEIFQRKY